MRQNESTRLTVDVVEAAEILGISRNAAYSAVREGSIPAIRLGKRIVIPRAALDRLLAVGSEPTAQSAA